ncbi:MAG: hypothetical protein R3C12_23860 [Planctomycetaceae bacterium]
MRYLYAKMLAFRPFGQLNIDQEQLNFQSSECSKRHQKKPPKKEATPIGESDSVNGSLDSCSTASHLRSRPLGRSRSGGRTGVFHQNHSPPLANPLHGRRPLVFDEKIRAYRIRPGYKFPLLDSQSRTVPEEQRSPEFDEAVEKLLHDGEAFADSLNQLLNTLRQLNDR